MLKSNLVTFCLALLLFAASGCNSADTPSKIKSKPQTYAEKAWADYYQRNLSSRLSEARQIWTEMEKQGHRQGDKLIIDFMHYAKGDTSIAQLRRHLSGNYNIQRVQAADNNYFVIEATTRPYLLSIDETEFLDWISFMCQMAKANGAVFSNFTVVSQSLRKNWKSRNYEQ